MKSTKQIDKEFWMYLAIFSVTSIVSITTNSDDMSSTGKFLVGMVTGIGLACLVLAVITLVKPKK